MPGYFSDDSIAVQVMSKRAVGLTYGQRALVIGATNPPLYVGTATHTTHRETPWNRLALTARLFETVFLGTKEEADRALAFTQKKHATVHGTLPQDAGPHAPAGTRYDAHDPHLMFMTMAFTFDSAEAMHDLLVRPLTADEREGLWQDYVRWAELFGMPRDAAPATYSEFRSFFDAYLNSDELFLTAEAALVGTFIAGLGPGYPFPFMLEPAAAGLGLIVRGSLPPHIRDLYGITWNRKQQAAFDIAVKAIRGAHYRPHRAVPRPLRPVLRGSSVPGFKLVQDTERRNFRRGKLSMPGVETSPQNPSN
ncbi:oxygenase MpaB family protein [Nocardia neocaledoniensis]|uniref:oxygenase MpaB family protein n=1 Tax=Nocardia neocaledoniensis TaxID=236511 RepID=UPI002454B139|nr:oxygenase MpaB family protein [Nocardia neocaledoniensis]